MEVSKLKQKLTIEQRNAAFIALTPAEQRVELAKDVIAFVKGKQIEAASVYIGETQFEYFDYDTQVHEILEQGQTCKCCAMGALLLTHIYNTDNCTVDDFDTFGNPKEITERLEGIFDYATLRLIEAAYEQNIELVSYDDLPDAMSDPYWEMFDSQEEKDIATEDYNAAIDAWSDKLLDAKMAFKSCDSAEARLLAIMQNIIDNNGEFVI